MSAIESSFNSRNLNPLDIYVLPGYTVEVFAQG